MWGCLILVAFIAIPLMIELTRSCHRGSPITNGLAQNADQSLSAFTAEQLHLSFGTVYQKA